MGLIVVAGAEGEVLVVVVALVVVVIVAVDAGGLLTAFLLPTVQVR